jgi:hypothetical protein
VNVAPETCREKNEENKLDLLHLVGILFITSLLVYRTVSFVALQFDIVVRHREYSGSFVVSQMARNWQQ